jgi:pimeloyl-ACP methyl ester carboxylesterase
LTGVELHRWESGRGPAVLCIHETGTSSEVWRGLAGALGDRARTIAYDRRGWGRSPAPEGYTRTTIHEQVGDASATLARSEAAGAIACGAGLGAVVALALALQRPDRIAGAVLVEPPLLAFVQDATERLYEDGEALRSAVREGGPDSGVELYLSGRLEVLGAGAGRLPPALCAPAKERPLSLFAELAAIPAWPLPLAEMAGNERPVRIVASESSPAVLRQAATGLADRLQMAELRESAGSGAPHLANAEELAATILELA